MRIDTVLSSFLSNRIHVAGTTLESYPVFTASLRSGPAASRIASARLPLPPMTLAFWFHAVDLKPTDVKLLTIAMLKSA
jgi:hypothetical protein